MTGMTAAVTSQLLYGAAVAAVTVAAVAVR